MFIIIFLLHLIAFEIYFILMISILTLDRYSLKNKLSTLLFFSLIIWSVERTILSIPFISQNTAIWVERIGSIGWILFAPVGILFVLSFINKNNIIKQKLFLSFLFTPASFFIFYNFIKTPFHEPFKTNYGWISVWHYNLVTFLFFAYYISIMITGTILLYIFYKKTTDNLKKKQAKTLYISILSVFILGTTCEIILPSFKIINKLHPLTNFSIILGLIWAVGMFLAIFKYNLLAPITTRNNIISNMSEALFILDSDFNIIFYNDFAKDLLKYSDKELKNFNFLSLICNRKFTYRFLKEILSRGIIKSYEIEIISKNKDKIPVNLSARLLKEQDEIKGVLCLLTDLTEKKKIEKQLQEEKEKLKKYLEIVGVMIVKLNKNGEVELINKKGCEILEYSENEIIGKNWFDNFLLPEEKEKVKKVFDKLMSGEIEPFEYYENYILTKNKNKKLIAWHNTLLYENGEIIGTLSAGEDITDKKRFEQELKEAKERLQDFLDNASDIIQVVSPECKFLYVNKAWHKILKYTKEDLKKITLFDILHPDERHHCENLFKCVINNENTGIIETRFVSKNGEIIYVEGHVNCYFKDGKPVSTRGIFRDVTQKKKIEITLKESYNRLKELDKLKSNFLSMVSHELRTPLTSIKGFLTFLLTGVAGKLTPQQREYLEIIKNNSDRLLNIINELLDVSKIESGTFSLTKTNNDIIEILNSSIKDIKSLADNKKINLNIITEFDKYILNFDPQRISQVIINLLNNAIKFSPENSTITVKLFIAEKDKFNFSKNIMHKLKSNKFLVVSIKDEGPGIEKDKLNKIFDRFYQIEDTNKRKAGGTGLGLYISQKIIEKHDGFIWVESEGKNKGATFYFVLPVE